MVCLIACLCLLPATFQGQSHAELAQGVDRLAQQAVEEPACVGLSVAVALAGDVFLARGYGLAEVEHDVHADAETLFRIGSITKQFTAAGIVRLAEEQRLWIDDELTDYLPDYPVQGHAVTLRHLLTHTSGIQSYTDLGEPFFLSMARELSHGELLELFAPLPFEFAPGERHAYNNSGYYLLGMVIEEVSGASYAEYLRSAFFEPLGMERTCYGSNSRVIPNRAQGYTVNGAGELQNDALIGMSQPGAAGALLSTAGELLRWQRALVSGAVVSPEGYAEMVTPYLLSDARETEYGFGLSLEPLHGKPSVSHGGAIPGFNSFLAHFVEQDLSVAVLSNSEGYSAQELALQIADLVLASR